MSTEFRPLKAKCNPLTVHTWRGGGLFPQSTRAPVDKSVGFPIISLVIKEPNSFQSVSPSVVAQDDHFHQQHFPAPLKGPKKCSKFAKRPANPRSTLGLSVKNAWNVFNQKKKKAEKISGAFRWEVEKVLLRLRLVGSNSLEPAEALYTDNAFYGGQRGI